MDLRKIRRDLIQVVELVEGWTTQSEISDLERDLALDKIRAAYEAIRFDGVRREPMPQPNVSSEPTVPVAPVVPVVPTTPEPPTAPEPGDAEEDDEPEVEIELIMADDALPESFLSEDFAVDSDAEEDDEPEEDLSDGEYDDVEPIEEEDDEPSEEGEEQEPIIAPAPEPAPAPMPEPTPAPEPAPAPMPEPTPAPEPAPAPMPTAEPIEEQAEEPTEPSNDGSLEQLLFGFEAPAPKRVRRRSVMMSLYNDEPKGTPAEPRATQSAPAAESATPKPTATPAEPTPAPKSEPIAPKPTPAPAPKPTPKVESMPYVVAPKPMEEIDAEAVLGEVLMPDVQTLGDTLGCSTSVADTTPISSLRRAIAVADKFMIMRELFDGNEQAYNRAIEVLDGYDNFDDCMVHIVENYSWRTTSEGARLIIDLLQRKFQQK